MSELYDPNPASVIIQDSVLGFGINTLKADGIRTKNVIFDSPVLKMNELAAVRYKETSQSVNCETASSIKELAEKVSADLSAKSEYCGLTAGISKSFSDEQEKSTNTVYTKWIAQRVVRREFFQKQDLKAHLDSEFSADLNSLSPEALFLKYGTHVIVEAYYGGGFEMSVVTRSDSRKSTKELKLEITAAFQDMCKFEDRRKWSHRTEVIESLSSFSYDSWGGKACTGISLADFYSEYNEWLGSVADAPEFCGVPSERSLLPVWELTDDIERRTELEEYYNKCADDELNELSKLDLYVVDLKVVTGGSRESAKANVNTLDAGYHVIDVDLNKGCGRRSDYVYLCYKLGKKEDAITNILCSDHGKYRSDGIFL